MLPGFAAGRNERAAAKGPPDMCCGCVVASLDALLHLDDQLLVIQLFNLFGL